MRGQKTTSRYVIVVKYFSTTFQHLLYISFILSSTSTIFLIPTLLSGGVIPAEREMRSFRYGGGVASWKMDARQKQQRRWANFPVVTPGPIIIIKSVLLFSYYYYQHHIVYLYNLSHFEQQISTTTVRLIFSHGNSQSKENHLICMAMDIQPCKELQSTTTTTKK